MFSTSPYLLKEASVTRVMAQVCLALIPGVAAYVWFISPIILVQLAIASLAALLGEALMLHLRGKPLSPFLADGSVIVTAWLIALAFPPLAPWWLLVVCTLFAVVVGKHLYGGLGQNPFNPAMLAFAVGIVSFPALMSQWPGEGIGIAFNEQLQVIFGLLPRLDALSTATPLDALKTGLRHQENGAQVSILLANPALFGLLGGKGWEWISAGFLLGGLWLLARRIITWHVPAAFLAGMLLISGLLWALDAARYANPLFHIFTGGTLLGAFFIATDPVSGCTTPRGKLIFGALAGMLAYVIRVFGGYPDGVAFAVLILNIAAPLIDALTQPAIFGMKDKP